MKEERRRLRDDEDEATRHRILDAAMARVPEMGWTKEALRAGAADAGFSSVTAGVVGGGPAELLRHHVRTSDAKLEDIMAEETAKLESRGEPLRSRHFVREMLERRLRMNAPYLRHWAEAVALGSHPLNVGEAAELDLRLADAVCRAAGDRSSDLRWYARRLAVAAAYKSAELVMMEDKSEDFADTWDFLDRRFAEGSELAKLAGSSGDVVNVMKGVAATVQNIVGLDRK